MGVDVGGDVCADGEGEEEEGDGCGDLTGCGKAQAFEGYVGVGQGVEITRSGIMGRSAGP